MIQISKDQTSVTIIAVHSCLPENQNRLEAVLKVAANEFYAKQTGFISSSIHKSMDGKAVTNYAQWETSDHLAQARNNPDVEKYISQVNPLLIGFEAHLYKVVETIEK
jgi:quinol monooxygenase YgiN